MDTKFSVAIHTLILISESETPMTSEEIAISVGTNASYIRKITRLLKHSGIIDSRQGVGGFTLCVQPAQLSLRQIYLAVQETDHMHLLDIHQNPNDACIVGRHIRPVLRNIFSELEAKAEQTFAQQTLADCMDRMRAEIQRSE